MIVLATIEFVMEAGLSNTSLSFNKTWFISDFKTDLRTRGLYEERVSSGTIILIRCPVRHSLPKHFLFIHAKVAEE